MKKGLGLGITLLLLSSLSACGKFVISDNCSCGYYTSNSGAMIHWQDGANLHFVTHKDVPEANRSALLAVQENYFDLLENTQITIETSNDVTAPDVQGNDPNSVSGDGVNGIYILQEPWPFKDADGKTSDTAAMTVIRADGSGLHEADIFVRASKFPLTDKEKASQDYAPQAAHNWIETSAPFPVQYFYKVVNHEMGHALGLVHTTDDSIMQPIVKLDSKDPVTTVFTKRDRDVFAKSYALKQKS